MIADAARAWAAGVARMDASGRPGPASVVPATQQRVADDDRPAVAGARLPRPAATR